MSSPSFVGRVHVAAEHSLDPSDWRALRDQGHRMLDDMFDHLQTPARAAGLAADARQSARAASAGRCRAARPRSPRPTPASCADVLPYASGNAHPGFMGWVQGGGTPVGMLAEMLAGGPERQSRRPRPHADRGRAPGDRAGCAELFGFPATASGLFVTGASHGQFRRASWSPAQRPWAPRPRGTGLRDGARLTAYASTRRPRLRRRAPWTWPAWARDSPAAGRGRRAGQRIDIDALRQADRRRPRRRRLDPSWWSARAGSVDTGAIDDLAALADIAAREGLHFHVDGAFGALAVLAPALRAAAGGHRARRLHRFRLPQVGPGALRRRLHAGARRRRRTERTFAADAAYLRRDGRGLAGGDWWPCDFGPDLSRGFRALKIWFTLKTYGAGRAGRGRSRAAAPWRARLAARGRGQPELELLAPVTLNIVCFRYAVTTPIGSTPSIVADLQEAGEVAPSLTTVDGKVAIRAALVNHRTEERDLDALVRGAVAFGDAATRGAA